MLLSFLRLWSAVNFTPIRFAKPFLEQRDFDPRRVLFTIRSKSASGMVGEGTTVGLHSLTCEKFIITLRETWCEPVFLHRPFVMYDDRSPADHDLGARTYGTQYSGSQIIIVVQNAVQDIPAEPHPP